MSGPVHAEVLGRRLEIARYGDRDAGGPTLVFLHEGLGCVSTWRDFPERLCRATGLDGLAYSRGGYGRSDPVPLPRDPDYMHVEGERVLPALLAAERVERAVLVGHSDGGSIALVHAGGGDPRIAGVVTLAAHVFNEPCSRASIRAAGRLFREGDLRARLARHHGDNVDCAFLGWHDAWLDPRFIDWDIAAYLPGIRAPLLALQGADDEYGTEAQIRAIEAGAGGPVTVALLPGCGHAPQRDQPDLTLALAAGFVATLSPG